jgi:hypothetical protein
MKSFEMMPYSELYHLSGLQIEVHLNSTEWMIFQSFFDFLKLPQLTKTVGFEVLTAVVT